jgi:hypothetical protein
VKLAYPNLVQALPDAGIPRTSLSIADERYLPRVLTGVRPQRCSFNNLRNVTNLRNIRSIDVPIYRFSQ